MDSADISPVPCDISVVAPAYNEEANIEPLVEELEKALQETGRSYEIVVVDDGSTDGSRRLLERLCAEKPAVTGVFLAANSGQSAATVAGFRAAGGRILFTIDADLQNNPADMPRMLELLEEKGADSVCGIRAERRDSFVRRLSSRIGNGARRMALGDSLVDTGCALKCFKREFVVDLPCFNGLHRFLGAMLEAQGAKVEQMNVDHRPRTRGKSKYGVGNRMWRGMRDLFGVRWLRDRWVKVQVAQTLRGRSKQS